MSITAVRVVQKDNFSASNKTLQFHEIRTIGDEKQNATENYCTICTSNRYGSTLVVTDGKLHLIESQSLLVETGLPPAVDSGICSLGLSSDESLLAVAKGSNVKVYETKAFLQQPASTQPKATFVVSKAGANTKLLAWNPAEPRLIAALGDDGTLILIKFLDNWSIEADTHTNAGFKCMSWSPKGKQLAVGGVKSILQLKTDLKIAKTIALPPDTVVVSMLWLANTQFLLAAQTGTDDMRVMLLNVDKTEAVYSDYGDIFLSEEFKSPQTVFKGMPEWKLFVLGSSTSSEIAVMGYDGAAQNPDALVQEIEDRYRPGVPIDHFCHGISLYLGTDAPVEVNGENVGQVPILLVLTQKGLLKLFKVLNPGHPNLYQRVPEPIQVGQGSAAPAMPPVAIPPKVTTAAPPAFSGFSTSFGSSGASPAPTAVPALGSFSFRSSASGAAPIAKPAFTSTPVTTAASPAFSFGSSSSGTSLFGAPAPAASPASTTVSVSPASQAVNTAILTQAPPTQVATPKPIQPAPTTVQKKEEGSLKAAQQTQQSQIIHEALKQYSAKIAAHQKSIAHPSQAEVEYQKFTQWLGDEFLPGLRVLMDFAKDIKETTDAQIEEVELLHVNMQHLFSKVEQACVSAAKITDPRYVSLHKLLPLDAGSSKKFSKVDKVNTELGNKLKELVRHYSSLPKTEQPLDRAKTIEVLRSAINNHAVIIRNLKIKIGSLKERMLVVYGTTFNSFDNKSVITLDDLASGISLLKLKPQQENKDLQEIASPTKRTPIQRNGSYHQAKLSVARKWAEDCTVTRVKASRGIDVLAKYPQVTKIRPASNIPEVPSLASYPKSEPAPTPASSVASMKPSAPAQQQAKVNPPASVPLFGSSGFGSNVSPAPAFGTLGTSFGQPVKPVESNVSLESKPASTPAAGFGFPVSSTTSAVEPKKSEAILKPTTTTPSAFLGFGDKSVTISSVQNVPAGKPLFGFGATTGSADLAKPPITTAASEAKPASASFSLPSGVTITPVVATAASPGLFGFGSVSSFAAPGTSTSSGSTPTFSFGASKPAAAVSITPLTVATSASASSPVLSSLLSTPSTTAAVTAVSTASIFGSPASSGSMFGGTGVSKSLFGASTPTSTTTPSVFGSLGFGGTPKSSDATPTLTAEPVKVSAAASSAPSVVSSSTPATSAAQATATPVSTTSSSLFGFGSTAKTTASGLFGSLTPLATTTAFAASPATSTSSIFGANATSTTSAAPLFGATSATTTSSSLFGAAPTKSTGPLFGATSTTPAATTVPTATVAPQPPVITTGSSSLGAATTTTSSSIFGSPLTSATTTSSFFGSPAANTSIFGSPANTSAPLFGTPTQPAVAAAGSLFGTPTTTTAATSSPAFGSLATAAATPSAGSIFGANTPTTGTPATTTTSLFGAATAASTPSIFGQSGGGLFGSPAVGSATAAVTTTTQSLFGSTSTPAFGTSLFGGGTTTAEAKPSIFGGATPAAPSAATTSIFGGGGGATPALADATVPGFGSFSLGGGSSPATQKSGGGLFGSSSFGATGGSGDAKPAGGVFGSGSVFGGGGASPAPVQASNIFGGGTSTFGGGSALKPSALSGTTSVFGGGGAAATGQPSAFGGGGGFSSPAFGSTQQPQSPFGGGVTSPAKPAFGQPAGPAPAFGSAPVFGGSPAFGGGATFGGMAPFGSSGAATAPSGAPGSIFGGGAAAAQSPGFGALGSTANTGSIFGGGGTASQPSFGSFGTAAAAPTQQPGFGSPSSFGSFGQAQAQPAQQKPEFSNKPAFSSWR